jgi:hypothetical protein
MSFSLGDSSGVATCLALSQFGYFEIEPVFFSALVRASKTNPDYFAEKLFSLTHDVCLLSSVIEFCNFYASKFLVFCPYQQQ